VALSEYGNGCGGSAHRQNKERKIKTEKQLKT